MEQVTEPGSSNEQKITDDAFRIFLETASDPIVIVDARGRIQFTNLQVQKSFGYRPDELINQPVEVLMPLRLRNAHQRVHDQYMKHPRPRPMGTPLDLRAARKDGTEFPVDISLVPYKSRGGLITAAFIRDISEHKKAVQLREEMMGIVSHDLKNPLASIVLNNQLLQRVATNNENSERVTKFSEAIRRSAIQMERLISDLLNFAKIESGTLEVEIKRYPAIQFIEDAMKAVQHHILEKQVDVQLAIATPIPFINYDLVRMTQVFYNILGNAIKFSNHGAAIEVALKTTPQELVFSVHDNGPGIPISDIKFVFEKFWQAKETAKLGCGLGLFIAKAVVLAHGGRIWAESEVGHGTTFFFTLPAAQA